MKIRSEVIIDAEPKTVWRMLDNPDNLKKWQPTLKSVRLISGARGQPGAISELIYDENGREVRMIEHLTERREPHFMAGSYASDWGKAIVVNHFEDVGKGRTRWVAWWNQTPRGFRRFLSPFMKRSLAKRIDDDLQRFKLMVETESA